MVNLWPGVPTKCLCDKHLNAVLAEYNNLLLPSMKKDNSIKGYILHGCVVPRDIVSRIEECLRESKTRGHLWKYLPPSEKDEKLIDRYCVRYCFTEPAGSLEEMAQMNRMILKFRCPECRKRIEIFEKP